MYCSIIAVIREYFLLKYAKLSGNVTVKRNEPQENHSKVLFYSCTFGYKSGFVFFKCKNIKTVNSLFA